jgi:hypothetical protein
LLVGLDPADAAEGRFEINQTCALAGCFSGDDPGFPVTISAAGSYVLTGSLSAASSTDAILVLAGVPQVDIDLNGFEIVGPVTCTGTGASLSCSPSIGGAGISRVSGLEGDHVRVRNGRVGGFPLGGIRLGNWAQVEGVTVYENRGTGILVSASSLVSRCIAYRNGGDGISAGAASVVSHSIASANKGSGIVGWAAGAVVEGSAAAFNGGDGIGTSLGALVQGNVANGNALTGIAVEAGSTVIDNASHVNASAGIYAIPDGSAINRNAVRLNGGAGMFLAPTSSYRENTLTSNGATVFSGVNLGANFCNTAPCP